MLNSSAKDIANPQSNSNLTKDITNQIVAQDSTALNATVIKSQDEMLGSLLDIKA
jgi:flagellar hook protein FlgE